jgi:hypothetical protein
MKHTLISLIVITLLLLGYTSKAQTLTVTLDSTSAFCNWNSTGCIYITASGGTAPYSYTWSNGNTTQNQCGLYAGSYNLTVTDANGISGSANFSGSSFGNVVNANFGIKPELCGQQDGAIWIDSITGTPPFNIWWSDGSAADSLQNLSAGTYYVRISDSQGCVAIYDGGGFWGSDSIPFTIPDSTTYSFNITTHPHHCPQLGSAAVHITGGGVAPFSYAWSTTPIQTTDSASNLIGGNYKVTISDAAGCEAVRTVVINNDLPINAITTNTPEVCIMRNGTATAIPQSGVAPYTYIWNTVPPQTTITASGLVSDAYYVSVLDANNCMAVRYAYVGYTSPIRLNLVTTDEQCHNDGGNITLTPVLGTSPYSYQWSNNQTGNSIAGLNQGHYSVTVSDAAGCSVVAGAYVNDVPSFNVNITYNPTSCTAPTGSATANISGSTGPYTYFWSTSPPQTGQTASGLAFGSYTCIITDVNGCIGRYSVSIPYIHTVSAYLNPTAAYCNTNTGAVDATVQSGTPPYTYRWSNNQTTEDISGLTRNYYYVTITDASGCTTTKGVYVGKYSNMQITNTHSNASCIFVNDGTATANVLNATPPLTYNWSNGQNTQTATGLTSGFNYRVYVTDANGCAANSNPVTIGYNNLSCAAQVSGRVINDWDRNCALTTGDEGIPNINVQAIAGYYDFTDANGDYSFILPAGNYAINHTPPYHTFQECPVGPIVLTGLTAGSNIINADFFDTVRIALDLWNTLNFVTDPRPGFNHQVIVNFGNHGNFVTTGAIEFEYDSSETFVSSGLPSSAYVHDIANRKIYFNGIANNLLPGQQDLFSLTFNTAATVALGTDIKNCVHITPLVNDVNFIDNDYCAQTPVVGSYDPNDKKVIPAGVGAPGFITRNDSMLHYTIRFQNTGTFYAANVLILDSLDSDVDPGSIEQIVSSHPVKADFFQNKTLAFYFDGIFLPDSLTNEPGSHGFVSFYIKHRPALAYGTQIKNRGAIYFDYNAPIFTNTVVNTIETPSNILPLATTNVLLYPNPTAGLLNVSFENPEGGKVTMEVANLLGQTTFTKTIETTGGTNLAQLPLNNLAPGVYLLTLQSEQTKFAVKKFVIEK